MARNVKWPKITFKLVFCFLEENFVYCDLSYDTRYFGSQQRHFNICNSFFFLSILHSVCRSMYLNAPVHHWCTCPPPSSAPLSFFLLFPLLSKVWCTRVFQDLVFTPLSTGDKWRSDKWSWQRVGICFLPIVSLQIWETSDTPFSRYAL